MNRIYRRSLSWKYSYNFEEYQVKNVDFRVLVSALILRLDFDIKKAPFPKKGAF